MDIGQRLTFFREKKGLSVNALANRAGVSQSAVREIEKTGRQPTVENLGYICDALEISLKDFFDDGVMKSFVEDAFIQASYRLSRKQRQKLLEFMDSLLNE